MSSRGKSNTLYARIPSDTMQRLRTYSERQGMTLSAAAAELIAQGLRRGRGGYEAGWAEGFSACASIIDMLANADEWAERIRKTGDSFTAALRAAQEGGS